MTRKIKEQPLILEDSLGDSWAKDFDVVEMPLGVRPFLYLGLALGLIALVVMGRILGLSFIHGAFYRARAEANTYQVARATAPRGIIYDRFGKVLAENKPVFLAVLNLKEFLAHKELEETTLATIQSVLGIPREDIWAMVQSSTDEFAEPVVLSSNLTQAQLVQLTAFDELTLVVSQGFRRTYPDGNAFSSFLGYTGLTSADDLKRNPKLTSQDVVGKAGIEAMYDEVLQGIPGVHVQLRNSQGQIFEAQQKKNAEIGESLRLTIDADLQLYLYERLRNGLAALGRHSGVGMAVNPKTGEMLSLVSFPTYDGNLFSNPGSDKERVEILTSPQKPLFNRAISGLYSPGSTIKPLYGVAALAEGVVDPEKKIYSPGYLNIPNRYNPDKPTTYLDWRDQGWVNLSSAIAQSSNVFFYLVGGGSPQGFKPGDIIPGQEGIRGLGISRLEAWWRKFNLGVPTGIDLPGEAKGLLPSPEKKKDGTPWLLGDTYNVSIGQGTLLLTPIQLLNYISAIANGGTIHRPFLVSDSETSTVTADLTSLHPSIAEVQKGMREAVTSPLGTAHLLNNLPVLIGAKTGSAQVRNNEQENAFFVGYVPYENPEIAILVLIENSKEGSLNAVPIAKDVLNWYYWNRLKGQRAN